MFSRPANGSTTSYYSVGWLCHCCTVAPNYPSALHPHDSQNGARCRIVAPTANQREAATHVPRPSGVQLKRLQLATRDGPGLPNALTRHQRAHLKVKHAALSHADNRSRGWRSEASNRTRRPRYRWEGDAWASEGWRRSGAWDGGPDGAATLSGDEVRLALSTSVGASEEVSYIDATLSNWLGFTMHSTHVVLHNDANRRTPLLRPSYLCAPRPERTFRPARPCCHGP